LKLLNKKPIQLVYGILLGGPVVLWAMLGMFVALTLFGCGKKSDPFIPKKQVSQVLRSVKAQYLGGRVVFEGKFVEARAGSAIQSGKIRLRVEYNQYSNGKVPCDTCPIDFKEHDMIQGKVSQDGKFTADWLPPESKGLYVLRLRVVGKDGDLGPLSERIRVVVR